MFSHLKKLDWILIISAVLLVGIGLLFIYSSSHGDFLNFKKQIIFFGAGFFLMILLSFFDYRILKENSYLILALYLFCLVGLLGLFFFAPEIRGTKSWYKLGPVSVDPIEFTKIILIILLAKYFSMRHVEIYRFRHILLSGFYVLVPGILIFMQPNVSSVLILVAIWIAVLFISGINLRHFLILSLIFLLIFALSWSFLLKDYQKERVISFVFPQYQPLKTGWSQNQAQIAIGSGGIFGRGLGKGSQTQYGFLSEPQTDFIFAAICEELGFFGIAILMIIFMVLGWRIFKLARTCQSNFPRLFAIGFLAFLVSQAFINIGMNLGILPVIGVPLPLISYGGSNLISVFLGLGILQSIKTHGA